MPNHFFVLPGLAPGVGPTQRAASSAQSKDIEESFESVSARLGGGQESGTKTGLQGESLAAASNLDSKKPGFSGSSTFESVATSSGSSRWRVINAAATEKPVEYAIGLAPNGIVGGGIETGGGINTKLDLASRTSADYFSDLKNNTSDADDCELSSCPAESLDDLVSDGAIDVLPAAVLLNAASTAELSKSSTGLSDGADVSEAASAFAGQSDASRAFAQPEQPTIESNLTFPQRGSSGSEIESGAEASRANGLESQSFLVSQGSANSEGSFDAADPSELPSGAEYASLSEINEVTDSSRLVATKSDASGGLNLSGHAAGEMVTPGGSGDGSQTQVNGDNVAAAADADDARQGIETLLGTGGHPAAANSGLGASQDVAEIQSQQESETNSAETSHATMDADAPSIGNGGQESTSVELRAAQASAIAVQGGVRNVDEKGAKESTSESRLDRTEESPVDISADSDVAKLSPSTNAGNFGQALIEGDNMALPSGRRLQSGAENDAAISGAIDARVSAGQAESIQDDLVETLSLEALIMEEPSQEGVRQAGEAIGDAIRSSIRSEGRSVQMDLHPAELGALKIQVTEVDDTIETRILATEYATSELLNSHREQLIDILTELGYEASNVDISHDEQSSSGWEKHQHPAEFTYQSKSKTRPVQSLRSATTGGINIIA